MNKKNDSTPPSALQSDLPADSEHARAYWKANLRILAVLLAIWFAVSYGCGILLADWLDQFQFFGFKLGFWFAQQGSIYVFVVLIVAYTILMRRLDHKFGFSNDKVVGTDEGEPS